VRLRRAHAAEPPTNGHAARDDLDDAVARIETLNAERAEAEAVRVSDDAASAVRETRLVEELAHARIDRDECYARIRAEHGGRAERARTVELLDRQLEVLRKVVLAYTERWLRDALARADEDRAAVAQHERRLLHELAGVRAEQAAIDARCDRFRDAADGIREAHDKGYGRAIAQLRKQGWEQVMSLARNRPGEAEKLADAGDADAARALEVERERVRYERNIMADVAERGFRELGLEHPQPDAIAKLRGEPVPDRPDKNEVRHGEKFRRIER
jgi:hypothetical protein